MKNRYNHTGRNVTGRQVLLLAGVAVMSAATLTACSSGTSPGGSTTEPTGTQSLIDVTWGVLPSVTSAPDYVAYEEGFFEAEGLNVTLQQFQGGSVIVEAIVSGSIDGGEVGSAPLVAATSKGIDLVNVLSYAMFDQERSPQAVIVAADSSLKTLKDLRGHKIAVNTLGSLEDMRLKGQILPSVGLTTDDVELLQLPWPNMAEALARGQVDAVLPFDPFTTQMVQDTDRFRVLSDLTELVPDGGLPLTTMSMSGKLWSSNPELAAKFAAAIGASIKFIEENPERAAQITGKAIQVDSELVEATLANLTFSGETTQPKKAYENLVDVAKKAGLLPANSTYDPSRFLVEPTSR